jgi:hypothetical protein
MAGAEGIEPSNDGIKIRCLTAWLRPNIFHHPVGPQGTEGDGRSGPQNSTPCALAQGDDSCAAIARFSLFHRRMHHASGLNSFLRKQATGHAFSVQLSPLFRKDKMNAEIHESRKVQTERAFLGIRRCRPFTHSSDSDAPIFKDMTPILAGLATRNVRIDQMQDINN